MEQLYAFTYELYGAGPEWYNTYRYEIRMKDSVDRDILQKAADRSLKRYPYLLVKMEKDEKEIRFVPNEKELIVGETAEPPVLGGREHNEHLIAVDCDRNMIYVGAFHVVADGPGIYLFLKTLLYYYCSYRYGRAVSDRNICLSDAPVPEQEMAVADFSEVEGEIRPFGKAMVREAFQPPEKKETGFGKISRIKIPSGQLMRFVRENDGSPCVMLALLMSRAVERVHPDPEVPVVGVVPKNIRQVLGKPLLHNCPSVGMPVVYQPALRHMPFERQSTCFRAMTYLQSEPDNLLWSVYRNRKAFDGIMALKTLEERQKLARERVGMGKNTRTFTISYAGILDCGEFAEYIESIYPVLDARGYGFVSEVLALGDYFYISFMQEYDTDSYLQAFSAELEQAGLKYEMEPLGQIKVPGVRI